MEKAINLIDEFYEKFVMSWKKLKSDLDEIPELHSIAKKILLAGLSIHLEKGKRECEHD